MARRPPNLSEERRFWDDGYELVAGLDEVGKGAWAGPLTVGAAILPRSRRIYGVTDSKQLTEAKREAMFDRVAGWCIDWAIGHASVRECDELGMSAAQRLATQRALDGLGSRPDAFLIDGKWNFLPDSVSEEVPRKMLVKGDGRSLSIAAASILAKVTRDRIMRSTAPDHPGFAFEHNKGYPCWRHQAALAGYGPTSIHRRSWAFMDSLPWAGLHRVPPTPAQPSLF
jgi:ribonuclease HII